MEAGQLSTIQCFAALRFTIVPNADTDTCGRFNKVMSLGGLSVHSFSNLHLDDHRCFLCGSLLDVKSRADEHVIPKWLQSRFNLWNKHLTLLNGSNIPYRQLLIPCCSKCNNEYLAQLEDQISGILLKPFRNLTLAEENRLFQWSSKILFGLMRREMALQMTRGDRSKGSIVKRELLEDLSTFHHFMTSIIRPMRFEGFVPYSLFVTETLAFSSVEENFDYYDFIVLGEPGDLSLALCLAIRVAHFGVICVFQDNGYQRKHFKGHVDRFAGIPLHPIQFLEIACTAACKHSLLSFSPRYHSIATDDPHNGIVVLPANRPGGSIWNEWSKKRYASVFCGLARESGYNVPPPEKLYRNGQHYTWLYDEDGNPTRMSDREVPFGLFED